MKLFSISLICILSLITSNAYSADGINAGSGAEKKVEVQANTSLPTEISLEDTSFNNRKNKAYQVTVGAGNEYSVAAFSLSLAHFIDSSQIILFRYTRITQDQESDSTRSNELHVLRAYTLGYKKFLGNSFNIQPTLYYRKSSTDYINEGVIKSIGTPNLIYDDIGVGFRIGNEWQWDNFVLGIDWIGLNKSINKINSNVTWQGTPQALHFKEETNYTFISLYLGASF